MCPCGHVLVFPLPSLVSNTRTRPCGRVLVFGCYFLPPGHEERDTGVAFFVSGMVLYTPDMKTRPQCRVFVSGITLHPSHPLHPRHKECDHVVAFFMSGMLLTPHEKHALGACFSCLTGPLSSLTRQTCKTHPQGHVFRVRRLPSRPSPTEHAKHALGGHFLCVRRVFFRLASPLVGPVTGNPWVTRRVPAPTPA